MVHHGLKAFVLKQVLLVLKQAPYISSGRVFYLRYVNFTYLCQAVRSPVNRAIKIRASIFEGISLRVEVVATIAYIGDHWTAIWWCLGSRDSFFRGGS